MKRSLIAIASAAVIGAATLATGPVLAGPGHKLGAVDGSGFQLAHYAGPGGAAWGGWGPGAMANAGGMMHPGMMNRMMGGAIGPAMMGAAGVPCPGFAAQANAEPLTIEDARSVVEKRLQWQGNDRLRVGDITDTGKKGFIAKIETVDGSLVDTLEIDRKTGFVRPVR